MRTSFDRTFCSTCKAFTVHENSLCLRHKEEGMSEAWLNANRQLLVDMAFEARRLAAAMVTVAQDIERFGDGR